MKKLTKLQESGLRKIVNHLNEVGDNQNQLDNRLYIALKDLASLASYLSDPKKSITDDEVLKFRNELQSRYKKVDDAIGRYTKNKGQ